MGYDLFANSNRRQCFGKKMHVLRVFAFTKKPMWMRTGICKLVLLKNEVAYNWVMDHNTLKNYGTSG